MRDLGHPFAFPGVLDQVSDFVCDVAGHGAHIACDRTYSGRYIACPVFGLLVDLSGMFAEVVAGVLDVVTCIFQVTSELLTSMLPGLRSIDESGGRAGGYSE
jgi:hypothetical protein